MKAADMALYTVTVYEYGSLPSHGPQLRYDFLDVSFSLTIHILEK